MVGVASNLWENVTNVIALAASVDHDCDRMNSDSVAVGSLGSHLGTIQLASESDLASCCSTSAKHIDEVGGRRVRPENDRARRAERQV